MFGAGLGLGETRYLPAGHTDLVLASVAEELGFAGLVLIAVVYAAMIARALSTARRATTDFGFFLATILALCLGVPVLLMAAGTLGVVPLTGVVTPFLSFGGSAMIANFAALGLLASLRSDDAPRADLEAFTVPLRWLGGALTVAAVALLVVAGRVQAAHADEFLVKPYLGMQADGMRRFQYNPRILDLARRIPRGTIADRNGLPLATDDRARLKAAAPAYGRAGVALDTVCADQSARCYPLGGAAFHVVGDALSRANWSASNTSFIERDREARLRGFDDRPVLVPIAERDGTPNTALRRDYSGLVPVYRHRFDADHPATKAALDPTRELRLTIDARLQSRVAAILADYARRSSTGRAAAVAVDAATGEVLASVSYPWPAPGEIQRIPAAGEPPLDAFLDRARYGQYAPGSTFKLITAAAALRRDSAAAAADLHLQPPFRRSGRRAGPWLQPADPGRREGSGAARHDRDAPRDGGVVQRLLRAAGGQGRAASACSTPRPPPKSAWRGTTRSRACAIRCRRPATVRGMFWHRHSAWPPWLARSRRTDGCGRDGSSSTRPPLPAGNWCRAMPPVSSRRTCATSWSTAPAEACARPRSRLPARPGRRRWTTPRRIRGSSDSPHTGRRPAGSLSQ